MPKLKFFGVLFIFTFLLTGFAYSYTGANSDRERLKGIENTVALLIERAGDDSKPGLMEALERVQGEIERLYRRIDGEVIRGAFLGDRSAVCQFETSNLVKETENIYFKKGKIGGSEELGGEKVHYVVTDLVFYNWNEREGSGMREDSRDHMEAHQSIDSIKEELIDEIKEDIFNCRYEEFDDSVFEVPTDIDFFSLKELMAPVVADSNIKNAIIQLRTLAETEYDLSTAYENFFEKVSSQNDGMYNNIRESVERNGGNLIVKFSKDFGEEKKYSDYCAYSPLASDTDKVFCIDSKGRALEANIDEVGCATDLFIGCV